MAGHSHWSKIKRAKGANDAKRGKVWSKIARKITGPAPPQVIRHIVDSLLTTTGSP